MIQLHELTNKDLIVIDFKCKSKTDALSKLVDLGYKNNIVSNQNKFLEEILAREKLNSTGIGERIAFPHSKSSYVTKPMFAVALLSEEIEFNSIDDKPVKLIIMFYIPKNINEKYISILALMSRFLFNPQNRKKLFLVQMASEIMSLLKEFDEK